MFQSSTNQLVTSDLAPIVWVKASRSFRTSIILDQVLATILWISSKLMKSEPSTPKIQAMQTGEKTKKLEKPLGSKIMSLLLSKWLEKNSSRLRENWGAKADPKAEEARAGAQITIVGVRGDLDQDQAQELQKAKADLDTTTYND